MNEYKIYTAQVLEICENGDAIIELSPELLEEMGWKEGTTLNFEEKDGKIFVTEVKN